MLAAHHPKRVISHHRVHKLLYSLGKQKFDIKLTMSADIKAKESRHTPAEAQLFFKANLRYISVTVESTPPQWPQYKLLTKPRNLIHFPPFKP